MSSEQIRLQVSPKLFGVNSWILQMIRQWIPDPWTGDRNVQVPAVLRLTRGADSWWADSWSQVLATSNFRDWHTVGEIPWSSMPKATNQRWIVYMNYLQGQVGILLRAVQLISRILLPLPLSLPFPSQFPFSASLPSGLLLCRWGGSGDVTPGKIFEILHCCRWVLVHLSGLYTGHRIMKNNRLTLG